MQHLDVNGRTIRTGDTVLGVGGWVTGTVTNDRPDLLVDWNGGPTGHDVWPALVEVVDQVDTETCACGQPLANSLPEALRTAGKRQCEACDLFDRL